MAAAVALWASGGVRVLCFDAFVCALDLSIFVHSILVSPFRSCWFRNFPLFCQSEDEWKYCYFLFIFHLWRKTLILRVCKFWCAVGASFWSSQRECIRHCRQKFFTNLQNRRMHYSSRPYQVSCENLFRFWLEFFVRYSIR